MSHETDEGFRQEDPVEVLLTISGWLDTPPWWTSWVRPAPRILVIYTDGIAIVSRRGFPQLVGSDHEISNDEWTRYVADLDEGRRSIASYRDQILAFSANNRLVRDGEIVQAFAHKGRAGSKLVLRLSDGSRLKFSWAHNDGWLRAGSIAGPFDEAESALRELLGRRLVRV